MSQNPYEAPRFESVGPIAELEPERPIRPDRSRLHIHAAALGHGASAFFLSYFAVFAWITFATRLLDLRGQLASLDDKTCAYLQALAPIPPGLLIWVVVLRSGLAKRDSPIVRWFYWTIFLVMIAGTAGGALLLDS